jgi:hypothetical protein
MNISQKTTPTQAAGYHNYCKSSWRKMTTGKMPVVNLSRQARQDLNPQPAVLETAALPVELLAYDAWGATAPQRVAPQLC